MKVLLVTGSSRGIGAEVCRRAATDGWKVCVNYANSADEADQLVAEIRDAGGIAIDHQADVANEAAVIRMFERMFIKRFATPGCLTLLRCAKKWMPKARSERAPSSSWAFVVRAEPGRVFWSWFGPRTC